MMNVRMGNREGGFSMLEVLVTMFVMAVALLGTAGLQVHALKVTQGSQFRGQAVLLGMDLLERVEANNAGAIAGAYAATLPASQSAADCTVTICTPAQMAAYDLSQLEIAMRRELPESTASITFAGTGPYTYTVQIAWRERATRRSSAQDKTEAFSYTVNRTVYDRASAL